MTVMPFAFGDFERKHYCIGPNGELYPEQMWKLSLHDMFNSKNRCEWW